MADFYIDHDKELRVLASCVSFPDRAISTVSEILTPDDFNRVSNRAVYSVLLKMFPGKPIDIMTVKDELSKNHYNVSDGDLGLIMAFDPLGHDLEWTARKVREISNRRRIYYFAYDLIKKTSEEGNYEELEDFLSRSQIRLQDEITVKSSNIVNIKDTVTKICERMEECVRGKDGLNSSDFIPTGFSHFDRKWGGLLPKTLVYLAGYTNTGKTLISQQMARHMSKRGPVLYVSTEVVENEFGKRILGIDGNISVTKLNQGPITEEMVTNVKNSSLELSDTFYQVYEPININGIVGMINKIQGWHNRGLEAVFIDRLELIDEKKDRGEDDVRWTTRMSKKLVHLSKIINCPLIVLVQFPSFTERRGNTHDHRPRTSDLKGSSALGHDAQTVIMIHREEMFSSNPVFKSVGELLVTKHMYGKKGGIFLTYCPEIPKFEDYTGGFDDLQKRINAVRNPEKYGQSNKQDKPSAFAGRTVGGSSSPDDGIDVNDNPF